MEAHGWEVSRATVPDERDQISALLSERAGSVNVILTTGGTGLTPRDVTPDATKPLLEREIPGIPEAIRMLGRSQTPAAILSLLGAPPSAEANATDAVHGTLHATRVGDTGARFEVALDAPVVAVNNVRDQIAALQAQQAQMMRQMQQAQQQAASAQRRAMQPGGPMPPSAAQLPEPDFQLQPPR
jgi:molybdenum cofactor synthesis domain-containing protein